ncbi:hypothetical protein BGZ51_005990 [Haplosporangium sp. Z 767]|nr:hypothetical protein BGZ51_005990 [Haplosporangium sp. Z 767]KAF9196926.1 hypothetical protein BGZ50_004513 [Haplosporangium sp. Z 11]
MSTVPQTESGFKPEEATFEEIEALTHQQDRKLPLIDVRDSSEVALGIIPTAHAIPLAQLKDALESLSDKEFQDSYGFKRFDKDDEVIFYCRSGRRSRLAFGLAKELGYTHVRHYPGSWIEWEARTKNPQQEN